MTASERTELYRNFLAEEGYAARIDDDGDVVFKCERMTFFISADEDDEDFFSLVCPHFWPIDSEEARPCRPCRGCREPPRQGRQGLPGPGQHVGVGRDVLLAAGRGAAGPPSRNGHAPRDGH